MRIFSAITPDKTAFSSMEVEALPAPDNWKNIPRQKETRFRAAVQGFSKTHAFVETSGTGLLNASYPLELRRNPETGEWMNVDPNPACRGEGDDMQRREAVAAALREAKRVSDLFLTGAV